MNGHNFHKREKITPKDSTEIHKFNPNSPENTFSNSRLPGDDVSSIHLASEHFFRGNGLQLVQHGFIQRSVVLAHKHDVVPREGPDNAIRKLQRFLGHLHFVSNNASHSFCHDAVLILGHSRINQSYKMISLNDGKTNARETTKRQREILPRTHENPPMTQAVARPQAKPWELMGGGLLAVL